MMELLVFKDKLRRFYGKYSLYINPLIKFAVGYVAFYLINSNVGFMTRLKNPLIPVIMGLVASIVPYGLTAFFAGCLLLVHVAQVSLEIALIIAVFMAAVLLLYYGFRPGDGYLLLLTPMLFFFNIPYVIPLLVGLSGGIVSIIPVSSGICIYYIIMYLKQNAGVLAGSSMSEMADRFIQIAKSVFGNELMWVMAAAFAAAILVVFIIKNLPVDHAWPIAIIAGVITQLIVIFVGDMKFELPISVTAMVIGMVVAVILALIYQFFVFAVDYTRTEYLQYEDDEYHYYVKAVPKIAVSAPDVKVQRIYTRKAAKTERKQEH
ncbi:MAG: ABC transporter permease [Lachnospiraceae bacterium]|nr:ABC transporter permease [Lachnospiraceae bacterium]